MKRSCLAISIVLALVLTACGASGKAKEHYDLGVKYISAGNYQEAILELTQAIEIDGKSYDAYVQRGQAYIALDQSDNAIADFRTAIELKPSEISAYTELAEIYAQQGDRESFDSIQEEAKSNVGESKTEEAFSTISVKEPQWKAEPYLVCDEIEPLLADSGSRKNVQTPYQSLQEYSDYIFTEKDDMWSLYDISGQQYILENQLTSPANVCFCGDLLSWDDDAYYMNAPEWSRALSDAGTSFANWGLTHGHGSSSRYYVYDADSNTLYETEGGSGPAESILANTPTDKLLAVQKGTLVDETEDAGGLTWYPDEGTPYAVASRAGSLVTDFVYQDAAMSTDKLIAVQNGTGNWGYVDETGEEVISCEYRPILHYGHAELSYPAPELFGFVVLQDESGQYLVKDVAGKTLIRAGQYEKLAPSLQQNCVWAQQGGMWGLLDMSAFL